MIQKPSTAQTALCGLPLEDVSIIYNVSQVEVAFAFVV
jgi:hypothetical protein